MPATALCAYSVLYHILSFPHAALDSTSSDSVKDQSKVAFQSLTLYSSISTSSGPISLSLARATFIMLIDLLRISRDEKVRRMAPAASR